MVREKKCKKKSIINDAIKLREIALKDSLDEVLKPFVGLKITMKLKKQIIDILSKVQV